MNIFILDKRPEICAKYHCDKHVIKMILESVQMLSTALRETGYDIGYKSTHKNHPCSKWVRESLQNYIYLRDLVVALNAEYKFRYNKNINHKSYDFMTTFPTPRLPDIGLTEFTQAMPEKYKSSDVVQSYRAYYLGEKFDILKYKNRETPEWVEIKLN